MLIKHGNILVDDNWVVDEAMPPTYSRVYYVYSGQVVYRDRYVKVDLNSNFLYIFPSTIPYSIKQNIERKLHCTFLHLDLFPSYVTKLIAINLSEHQLLKSILDTIAKAIDDGNIKIITSLSNAFERYCFEKEIFSPPCYLIAKSLEYIAKNSSENISLDNLSAHCGYSKRYFIKLFKRSVGITPYQYVINYRLKESLPLLAGSQSIAQIACDVGFSDSKAYCRTFKDKFGISPGKYRKNFVVVP